MRLKMDTYQYTFSPTFRNKILFDRYTGIFQRYQSAICGTDIHAQYKFKDVISRNLIFCDSCSTLHCHSHTSPELAMRKFVMMPLIRSF